MFVYTINLAKRVAPPLIPAKKTNGKNAKKADSHLLYELNKIGVNLNQIARAQNKNNIEHAELLIALDHIYSEVKKIREIYSE